MTAVAGPPAAALADPPTLSVQGTQLVDGNGNPVQLRGANRAAFDSRCTYDASGVADGPVDQASVDAMVSWKINVVRVTINPHCWLGINGLPLSGDAPGYQHAVTDYVNLLRQNGLYVILDAQESAAGTQPATMIDNMPDADHMPDFWTSVASTFVNDQGVLFDPINEVAMASWNDPHPDPAGQWQCWLNGCTIDSVYPGAPRYTAAGLQSLVDTIRATGATQPIILGGLSYNADLSQLLSYLPTDPQAQLVASLHVYDFAEGSDIDNIFTNVLEPIAAQLPVVIEELGERYCNSGTAAYTSHVLSLIDGEQAQGNVIGVLGWTWNADTGDPNSWHCPTGPYGEGGPLLITNYDGTPTVMGQVLHDWIGSK